MIKHLVNTYGKIRCSIQYLLSILQRRKTEISSFYTKCMDLDKVTQNCTSKNENVHAQKISKINTEYHTTCDMML